MTIEILPRSRVIISGDANHFCIAKAARTKRLTTLVVLGDLQKAPQQTNRQKQLRMFKLLVLRVRSNALISEHPPIVALICRHYVNNLRSLLQNLLVYGSAPTQPLSNTPLFVNPRERPNDKTMEPNSPRNSSKHSRKNA